MELWDYVADKLNFKSSKARRYVKNILLETIAFNEEKKSDLTESKLDLLVKLTGAFVCEIEKVINDPVAYESKLKEFRQKLIDETVIAEK